MIKLLLLPEVLSTALQQSNQGEDKLIEKCKNHPHIQAWTLSSTVEKLIAQGFHHTQISAILEDITQIPVNARLNQEALQSSHGFEMGIQICAAKIFGIPAIVACQSGLVYEGIKVHSLEEALNLPTENRTGKINISGLELSLHPILDQVDGWFMEIIQNTAFAGGNHVKAFEQEFAAYCKVKHVIGVNSGTDALRFILLALNIGSGDEVITVPNTFIATTEAISQTGAKPVFVDISPETFNMDPSLIESKITEKTKAILPVHLYGQIVEMDTVLSVADKYGLKVIEDACQAHGAKYKGRPAGSLGHAAAFSMYPGKNLGAFGEAGCAVTNQQEVATKIAYLRDHGQSKKYQHKMEGYNGRMDNMQAAVLRSKLPFLDEANEGRRRVAGFYAKQLADVQPVKLPVVANQSQHVFHQFVILVPEPRQLSTYLKQRDIITGFHYPLPLHLQEAYQERQELPGSYPVVEQCAKSLLSLPMFPELTDRQINRICDGIKKFFAAS